jgi:HD-GYP domain-containing protein (c-di-GMP phosphodiesterase class II)/anti-anti-sigma regulatory factor
MVRTKFERIDTGVPGVAAFRIEGKLGFHENAKIQRLVEECLKRELHAVIFDFTELSSLGGGVAKILRDFVDALAAKGGDVRFAVTNDIIAQFLEDGERSVSIHRSLGDALAAAGRPPANHSSAAADGAAAPADPAPPTDAGRAADPAPPADTAPPTDSPEASPAAAPPSGGASASAHQGVIMMPYDSADERRPGPAEPAQGAPADPVVDEDAEEIIDEIFNGPSAAALPELSRAPGRKPAEPAPPKKDDEAIIDLNRQLRRRILELKTLFSISADFNAIWDRRKLLDIFLLTAIAQGGVESAVFLENQGKSFRPTMSKGFEPEALMRLDVPVDSIANAPGENNVIPVDGFAMDERVKAGIKNEGIEYVCPFRTKDGISGIVLLGKRIAGRGMKQEDFEFLRILVNIAQGAYDNAMMFDREHERTLGIVKTLISIIEENTLLKGTSEFVSRYVGMVAKNMDYPEEHFKDLVYGTVLRDMGMVKVSDLILRSPRDLTKEEWEIIKRHPEDGAEMLSRMKFSDHVIGIVRTHHERFNGEGYPYGLRGKEIPLGSRIISVIESYAAMIHERPTRPALSEREALGALKENYGLRYDREVIMHFARIMEKEIAQSVYQPVATP